MTFKNNIYGSHEDIIKYLLENNQDGFISYITKFEVTLKIQKMWIDKHDLQRTVRNLCNQPRWN